MSKRTGNTLSLGQQANWHAAVLKALPRDIDSDTALNWERNGDALTKILRETLCPPFVAEKLDENQFLRRLYADKVITVCGRSMAGGRIMEVHELVKSADFQTIYGSLGIDLNLLWMSVAQREVFCEEHRNKISKTGLTFFLHKNDETKPATPDNLEVALVGVNSGGLYVNVYRFESHNVWLAENQRRLVSPQFGPP